MVNRESSSSVSFTESGGYTWGSIIKISAAWLFFAILAIAYAFVPIFSLIAAPALLGCIGIITQAYQTAEERRVVRQERTTRRVSRKPPSVGHAHAH
jgi:hypothetical protein